MKSTAENAAQAVEKIEHLREQIDQLDFGLILLLKKRFKIVEEIGNIKRTHNLPVFQKNRLAKLLQDRINLGENSEGDGNLNSLFIRELFFLIHAEALDVQRKPEKKLNVKKLDTKIERQKNLSGIRLNGLEERKKTEKKE